MMVLPTPPELGTGYYFSNPFYAGVESVGDDKVIIGSLGGVLYLSPGQRVPVRSVN